MCVCLSEILWYFWNQSEIFSKLVLIFRYCQNKSTLQFYMLWAPHSFPEFFHCFFSDFISLWASFFELCHFHPLKTCWIKICGWLNSHHLWESASHFDVCIVIAVWHHVTLLAVQFVSLKAVLILHICNAGLTFLHCCEFNYPFTFMLYGLCASKTHYLGKCALAFFWHHYKFNSTLSFKLCILCHLTKSLQLCIVILPSCQLLNSLMSTISTKSSDIGDALASCSVWLSDWVMGSHGI